MEDDAQFLSKLILELSKEDKKGCDSDGITLLNFALELGEFLF